jgi:hypothetical protein
MYLTKLADIARSAGLEVVEHAGWQTYGHGDMSDVRTITNHHTAGPPATRDPSDYPSLRTVRSGRPDLDGPLAQLGLGRTGRVHVIAAGLCWHAGQSRHEDFTNPHAVGIEVENDGVGEPYPREQLRALRRLDAALVDAFKLRPADVRAHRETCYPVGRKIDPAGIDMAVLRAGVARELDDLRASRGGGTRPPVAPRFTLDRVLIHDPARATMRGPDVKAVQVELLRRGYRLPEWGADGWYGGESVAAVRTLQRHKGLARDGRVGRDTTVALGGRWTG